MITAFIYTNTEITVSKSLGFIIFFTFFIINIMNYKAGILFYLFIRCTLDYFKLEGLFFNSELFNTAGLITISFIIIGIFHIAQAVKSQKVSFKCFRPFAIFLIVMIPSVIISINILHSIIDWMRFLGIFILFLSVFLYFKDPADLQKLVTTILLSLIIPCSVALTQMITDAGIIDSGFMRFYGTYVHPNMLAFYLMTVCLIIMAGIFGEKNMITRIRCYSILFVALFFLIFTYTRAAWIGFLAGVIIIMLFENKAYIPIVIVLLVVLVAAVPDISYRFEDIYQESGTRMGGLSSWKWRLEFWKKTSWLISKNNIFGIGPDTYQLLYRYYPHNDYLRLLIETGVVGLLAYIYVYLSIMKDALKTLFKTQKGVLKELTLAVLAVSVAYLLVSVSDNLSRSPSVTVYFYALAGVYYRFSLGERTA